MSWSLFLARQGAREAGRQFNGCGPTVLVVLVLAPGAAIAKWGFGVEDPMAQLLWSFAGTVGLVLLLAAIGALLGRSGRSGGSGRHARKG